MAALRLSELDRRDRRKVVRQTVVRIVVAWVALFTAYFTAPFDDLSSEGVSIVRLVLAVTVFVVALVWGVRRTLRSDLPQLRAVAAVGMLAPLVLVMFAGTYLSMSHASSASFNEDLGHISALYFSISTLATVGFGDIVARSDPARILVSSQILVDLLLLGSIVRLLGSAVRSRLATEVPSAPADPGLGAGSLDP